MSAAIDSPNRRILIVDDNESIHADFRKVLAPPKSVGALAGIEAALFGDVPAEDAPPAEVFELESVFQGQAALAAVERACAAERPFALAFVDVRMPPGWDGVETIPHLWRVDPSLQIVICSAYSDHSWNELIARLGLSDRLLILKKPFDAVEVQQLALALTEKWNLARRARLRMQEVEQIVEDRTRSLADAQRSVIEARDAAEAASAAKSRFLANVSHEVRTPMTAILGYAENLLDPALPDDERRTAAQIILRNGEHLLAILNEILDISKIEAGKIVIEQRECDPVQLLREIGALMRIRAGAKGLSLEVSADGPLPERILTDPTRAKQVLMNLVGNAIKFTHRGSVCVVARLRSESEPAIEFDVIDTGIGMTPQQTQRLFEPFQQADETTTREFGGTGLGLHISRRIAQLLGGDVFVVRSEAGAGSCFRATFAAGPLEGVRIIDAVLTPPAAALPVAPNAAPVTRLDGLRVLLAEDGADNQRLISAVLRKAGATVELAENGRVAVDAATKAWQGQRPFDVILMDMQMPEMDGYEATRQLRSAGYTHPILALTAHSMTGDDERCRAAGCDDYATKPIQRGDLLARVRRLTQQPASAAGIHSTT